MNEQLQAYMDGLDPKWRDAFKELKDVIDSHIPEGFECTMQNDMPSYVVPLGTYPAGYHCVENTPLPFISIAAQKKHLALYHMGI